MVEIGIKYAHVDKGMRVPVGIVSLLEDFPPLMSLCLLLPIIW